MVVTGGNLSLTGFDISSEEQFWTVTGDVANAMAILDFDLDQQKELIVGSDDYSIRVYKNEEMIFDINEDSKVQFLSKIEKASFAYALSNGSIGVYSGSAQKWKNRVDNRISALLGVDFDMDGSRQIMIGYQSGKFEVRKATDGSVTYKSNMGATVSKIMYEDYRMEGAPQVVVCNSDGDVKGYNISTNVDAFEVKGTVQKKEAEAINKMNLEIHKLKAELDEENKEKRDQDSATLAMNVPHDIKVAITQSTLSDSACIIFKVQSPLIIRTVILFSDKLFEEGTFVSCPGKASNTITIPIISEKNIECEIDCKIIVGKSLSSEDFMTVHETVTLKKFGFFKNIPFSHDYSVGKPPSSQVVYKVRERPNRILLWAQKVFNLEDAKQDHVISKTDSLDFMLLHVRNNAQLIVQARSESDGTLIQISYDDLETVGDMVQDLCTFIKVTELKPESIDFPSEKQKALELVENISEYDKLRNHFSANIAESVNNAKVFVVKAEFSLMLGDMSSLKKNYSIVQQENGNLIAEYMKRRNNHEELVKSLKDLNNFIRKASNLRVGTTKNQIGKLRIV